MKKLNILILSALTAVSGSALAMGGSIEQGKNFTNLNLEMGNPHPACMRRATG